MTARSTEQLKRDAKRLKKERGIPHTTALNQTAKQHGFVNWSHLLSERNKTQ